MKDSFAGRLVLGGLIASISACGSNSVESAAVPSDAGDASMRVDAADAGGRRLDAGEGIDAAEDAGEAIDAADAGEGIDAADAGEEIDAADAGEGIDAADAGERVDAADAGERMDAADAGERMDAADANGALDAADANGGFDAADAHASFDAADGAPTTPGAPGAPTGLAAAPVTVVATVTTLAGSGNASFADGTGTSASFKGPGGIAVDTAGKVYVGDSGNNRIRVVTPAGVVTTLAGSGTAAFANGTGSSASFSAPQGVVVDASGNVYVADESNNRIRKVTSGGVVTTLAGSGATGHADGTPTTATFNDPVGVALDPSGNILVADLENYTIRQVTPAGTVSTLAGSGSSTYADGTGTGASFALPDSLAFDASGALYVADAVDDHIRKITTGAVVSTFAGSLAGYADGPAATAKFSDPDGLAFDALGNLYVVELVNARVRRITSTGVVSTLAGSGTHMYADGVGTSAMFQFPIGVAVDSTGIIYVVDEVDNRVRKITTTGLGQLTVSWTAPTAGGSPITGYTASASATGQTTRTCTSTGALSCALNALMSGVAYSVTVTAKNALGTGAASSAISATPN